MSEPTIYKPSIYNGNGVYNTGAGGGGGEPTLPDIGVNTKVFKNFLPVVSYTTSEILTSDFVLKRDFGQNDPFMIFGLNNFTLSETDTFEVQFTVRKSGYSGSHNTVFGSVNAFHNNISLDFGNVNDNSKSVFFGVPRSTSPNEWTDYLLIKHLIISPNKWYTINVVCDENEINLYMQDDEGIKTANPTNKNNLSANSPLQLRGINKSVNNYFNGDIDLKNSYITKNGVLIWGCK